MGLLNVSQGTLTDGEFELLMENAPTEETQEIRMKALNEKHWLFIAGDFMYPAAHPSLVNMLKEYKSHGCVITAAFQEDNQGKYYQALRDAQAFDFEIFADIGAEKGAENLIKVIQENGLEFDAVWSPHETTQPIMGQVQAAIGCPGNDPAAYEKARDKYATRKALEDANLATCKAVQIWTIDDVPTAAEVVKFPMIIKPTVGMGSSGVYKCMDEEELHETVERLLEDIRSNWALNRNTIGDQAPILAETFITPTIFGGKTSEFDVDVLFWNGECVYGNVIDNWEPLPPYFQELASNAPSLSSRDIQQEIVQYCADAVKALGFKQGGFHMECWYIAPTPDNEGGISGPVLIECNPRIGGGATVQSHENVWGVNPMTNFFLASMGIPINPPRSLEPMCCYGYLLVNAQVTGTLYQKEITFLEGVKKSEMHVESTYLKQKGDAVKGKDLHVPDWLGEVHMKHDGLLEHMIDEMHMHQEIAHKKSAIETEQVEGPQE